MTAACFLCGSLLLMERPVSAMQSCEDAVAACEGGAICPYGAAGYWEVEGECSPVCRHTCHCEGLILPWSSCL